MVDGNQKAALRKRVLAVRSAMSEEERNRANDGLTNMVICDPLFLAAEKVLLFAGYGSETDTSAILSHAFACGKQVYLPKVIPQTQDPTMVFYRITNLNQLTAGFKGIMEPAGDTDRFSCREKDVEKSFLLVPGVVFDACGNRIGYGKGYYDRFLCQNPSLIPRSLGICFACQMVDLVPAEEQDIRIHRVFWL